MNTQEKLLKIEELLNNQYLISSADFSANINPTIKIVYLTFKNKNDENDIVKIKLENKNECSLAKFKLNQKGIHVVDIALE